MMGALNRSSLDSLSPFFLFPTYHPSCLVASMNPYPKTIDDFIEEA